MDTVLHFLKRVLRYPATLHQWLLISFVSVSLPLVFAIGYALVAMNNYSKEAHKTVFQTVVVTENSRLMLERLVSMERSLRQYQVLQEESLLEAYVKHHAVLEQLIKAVDVEQMDANLANKLEALKRQENTLYQSVYQQAIEQQKPIDSELLQAFEGMNLTVKELIRLGSQQQAKEVQTLAEYEQKVRDRTGYILLVSGLMVVLLSVFFVHFITLPIKRLGVAMRYLVKEDFETHIPQEGPKDVQELGQNLDGLRQELIHLENEKQQFIRNVSHELKTPLATLKEGTDLLSEELLGPLNSEQKEVTHLMRVGNFNIMNLVENLLEYQKVVSLQSRLDVQEFDVEALLRQLEQTYQLLLQSKSIELVLECSEPTIRADYEKLHSILSNLLSNAIKFAPQESRIAMTVKRSDDQIEIVVEDQGTGVDEAVQAMMFDAFVQGRDPHQLVMKGTGLGLAIVGYYVQQHGGQIELLPANEHYVGARFALRLPMERQ